MPEENTSEETTVPAQDTGDNGSSATVSEAGGLLKVGETVGHFTLNVTYKEGATEEEIASALPFIETFTKELSQSPVEHMPLVIEILAIKRLSE